MSNQYLDQFARIKRWHKRLEEIYRGREHDRESDYYQDVLYAFFQNCFHLKDWLVESNVISESDVDKFINSEDDMKICHALCIGSKHLTIRNPHVDPNIKVKNKSVSLSLAGGPPQIKVTYWIEANGGVRNAFDIATNCVALWEQFLKQNNLI